MKFMINVFYRLCCGNLWFFFKNIMFLWSCNLNPFLLFVNAVFNSDTLLLEPGAGYNKCLLLMGTFQWEYHILLRFF